MVAVTLLALLAVAANPAEQFLSRPVPDAAAAARTLVDAAVVTLALAQQPALDDGDAALPVSGLVVTQVRRGGLAEGLGIPVGAVFTALDGTPLGDLGAFKRLRSEQPQVIRLASPGRGSWEATLQAGLQGVVYREWWRPDLGYRRTVKDGTAKAVVDADAALIRLAWSSWADNNALAETALAGIAGDPANAYVQAVHAAIALDQARFDDALALVAAARATMPKENLVPVLRVGLQAALASGRWPLAQRFLARARDAIDPPRETGLATAGAYDLVGPVTPLLASGHAPDWIDTQPRTDCTRFIDERNKKPGLLTSIPLLAQGRMASFGIPHYLSFHRHTAPGLRAADLEVVFDLARFDDKPCPFIPAFEVGLLGDDDAASVALRTDTSVLVHYTRCPPVVLHPGLKPDGATRHRLRMVVGGGWWRAFLDGTPLATVPRTCGPVHFCF